MNSFEFFEGHPTIFHPVDLSSSELATRDRCGGKWFLKYVLKRRPKTTKDTLAFGGIVHDCLAAYYEPTTPDQHRTRDLLLGLIDDGYNEHIGAGNTDTGGQLRKRLRQIMELYWEKYGGRDWTLADTEMNFRAPVFLQGKLVGFIHGRWDGILIDDAGLWVLDHKTTKRFSFKHLPLDPQLDVYSLGALKVFGPQFKGFIMNYIRSKPSTRSPNFQRLKVKRSLEQCAFIEESIGSRLVQMGSADPSQIYFSHRKTCTWDCDYTTICAAIHGRLPIADLLRRQFRVRPRHEGVLDD